jgi:hypothetical protein
VRSPLVAFVAASLLAVAIPPAHAETWHAADERRDVDTYSHSTEPPPCGTDTDGTDPTDELRDISGLRVDHEPDLIVIRLSMREVRRRDADSSYNFHLQVPAGAFNVDVIRFKPRQQLQVFLAKEPHYPEPGVGGDQCGFFVVTSSGRTCDGLTARADVRRDAIEVSLPRECVKDPRWVKVGAEVYGGFTGAAEDFTIHSDYWAPPGVEQSGFLPPYGPRVRRGQL